MATTAITTKRDIIHLLKQHAPRGGWLARKGPRGKQMGRWICACGVEGELDYTEGITDAHRDHLAGVLMRMVE